MGGIADAMAGRCPYCGQGELFESWYGLRETCDRCGARYLRQEGSWIGPTTIGYGVGAAVGVITGVVVILTDTYFAGAEVLIGLFACLCVLATYRWAKAYWIGLMCDWGYVYPDPAPKPVSGGAGADAAPSAPSGVPCCAPAPAERPYRRLARPARSPSSLTDCRPFPCAPRTLDSMSRQRRERV
jgi:uncharacterized protein (DUF983 family)